MVRYKSDSEAEVAQVVGGKNGARSSSGVGSQERVKAGSGDRPGSEGWGSSSSSNSSPIGKGSSGSGSSRERAEVGEVATEVERVW
jgi:hypothetical protein